MASAEFAVRRRECFVAAAQTLAGFSRDGRLLLVLDAVERFDTSSRRVTQALRHQPASAPVLVLVASDERDLSWLDAPIIELAPFGADEIEAATQFVCTGEDGRTAEFLQKLRDLVEPTPLHLELALRELAAGRELTDEHSEGAILQRRLDGISSTRRELLELACRVPSDVRR